MTFRRGSKCKQKIKHDHPSPLIPPFSLPESFSGIIPSHHLGSHPRCSPSPCPFPLLLGARTRCCRNSRTHRRVSLPPFPSPFLSVSPIPLQSWRPSCMRFMHAKKKKNEWDMRRVEGPEQLSLSLMLILANYAEMNEIWCEGAWHFFVVPHHTCLLSCGFFSFPSGVYFCLAFFLPFVHRSLSWISIIPSSYLLCFRLSPVRWYFGFTYRHCHTSQQPSHCYSSCQGPLLPFSFVVFLLPADISLT